MSPPTPVPRGTFTFALERLRGCFLQFTLEYPISRLPGGTHPIARLLDVESDYVVVDHVIVDGVRLPFLGRVLIRQVDIFAVARINVEGIVVDLALALRPGGLGG